MGVDNEAVITGYRYRNVGQGAFPLTFWNFESAKWYWASGASPPLWLRTGDSTGRQEAPVGLRSPQGKLSELHAPLGPGCWQKSLCSFTLEYAPPSWRPRWRKPVALHPPFGEQHMEHFQAQDALWEPFLEEDGVSITGLLGGSWGKRGNEMARSTWDS